MYVLLRRVQRHYIRHFHIKRDAWALFSSAFWKTSPTHLTIKWMTCERSRFFSIPSSIARCVFGCMCACVCACVGVCVCICVRLIFYVCVCLCSHAKNDGICAPGCEFEFEFCAKIINYFYINQRIKIKGIQAKLTTCAIKFHYEKGSSVFHDCVLW